MNNVVINVIRVFPILLITVFSITINAAVSIQERMGIRHIGYVAFVF